MIDHGDSPYPIFHPKSKRKRGATVFLKIVMVPISDGNEKQIGVVVNLESMLANEWQRVVKDL